MKLLLPISVIACAAVATVQAGTPTLYVFGDSLSDIGTLEQLTLGLLPSEPYWEGRFSSGPVWNEYLAPLLGYNLYNKAIGGATSDNKYSSVLDSVPLVPVDIPSCQNQISLFKVLNPFYWLSSTVNSDIAVLEIGANDFFAQVSNMVSGTLTPESFINTLSTTVLDQLEQLHYIGFRNFFIPDLAHIQTTPFAKMENVEALANSTVTGYNQVLAQKVSAWAASKTGLGFVTIGPIGKFVDVTALSPTVSQALGLTDTETSCLGGNFLNLLQADNKLTALLNLVLDAKDDLMCSDPSTNYFFDIVHPTERVQRLFGYFAKHAIDAARSGKTYEMSEANMLSLIKTYNLGTPAPKPARI
ncbi:hypothetical protein IWQ56_000162 [Coemansia nantahalensis]|nr:hypothetical protein IWQ56_000162 [Coemansia nantahalensis]